MRIVSFSVQGKTYIRPAREQDSGSLPISALPEWSDYPVNVNYSFSDKLYKSLVGRRLLLEEVEGSIDEVEEHVENGYVAYRKGITYDNGTLKCQRCGNRDRALFGCYPCSRCLQTCMYCRKCIMMGRISQCTPLVIWSGPLKISSVYRSVEMSWNGRLSVGQEEASLEVVKAIKNNDELLVWAVCGAGKTEVLFQGIQQALQMNKNICIASPRVDVIFELMPRMQKAFPFESIIALYGGSKSRGEVSNFVLATTHQLLHFYQYFDVIIIDEVDAFPYSYDAMLAYAVENAKKENASTILLSATPDVELRSKTPVIKVPARYHKYPLPIPTFCWLGNWRKKLAKKKVANKLSIWLMIRIQKGIPVFIFVPSVEVMKKLTDVLAVLDVPISSVHAEDQYRQEKVQQFRDGKISCLLTTTILERGVTVANLHVAVYGAEQSVFSSSALVQIAGRVGRSKDYPNGDVVFFHFGISKAMVDAQAEIIAMNREGKRRGLIQEG